MPQPSWVTPSLILLSFRLLGRKILQELRWMGNIISTIQEVPAEDVLLHKLMVQFYIAIFGLLPSLQWTKADCRVSFSREGHRLQPAVPPGSVSLQGQKDSSTMPVICHNVIIYVVQGIIAHSFRWLFQVSTIAFDQALTL